MSDISASKQKMIFSLVTILFFLWGFITCMNDILIPYLKKVFELNYAQAMLVQLAFFGAYFIGSLLYFIISSALGPINKIGYRKGIVMGLLLSAVGCLLFYLLQRCIYMDFLTALFVLGLGFTYYKLRQILCCNTWQPRNSFEPVEFVAGL